MNPPNAVLPILRKLRNRDHKEGPFIKGEPFFLGARPIVFEVERITGHAVKGTLPASPWRCPFRQRITAAMPTRFITAAKVRDRRLSDVRGPLLLPLVEVVEI